MRRDLADRVVLLRMEREREDIRIPLENIRGTVALMHIEVDNQRRSNGSVRLQHLDGDGDVVENAEPGTVRPPGMMTASGGVAGNAVFQCQISRQHGSASGAAGTKGDVFAHRKPDFPRYLVRHTGVEDLIHIGWFVCQRDPLEGSWTGPEKGIVAEKTFPTYQLGNGTELVHREPVIGGKIGAVGRMVYDRQGHLCAI